MKQLPPTVSNILLILINLSPFILSVILYSHGALLDIFFILPALAILTFMNCWFCKKTSMFILMQSIMFVAALISGYTSTYLYYNNISDDGMTLSIGTGLAEFEAILILIATIVIAIIKVAINKRKKERSM